MFGGCCVTACSFVKALKPPAGCRFGGWEPPGMCGTARDGHHENVTARDVARNGPKRTRRTRRPNTGTGTAQNARRNGEPRRGELLCMCSGGSPGVGCGWPVPVALVLVRRLLGYRRRAGLPRRFGGGRGLARGVWSRSF